MREHLSFYKDMKILSLLLLLLFSNILSSQETTVSEPITPLGLKERIIQKHAKNNLIYTYADWCAPCIAQFPKVINFCKANNVELYIIVLSKKANENLDQLQTKFKTKYDLNSDNVFNYKHNESFYTNKTKNRFKNYQAFMAELLGESYRPDYIYGSDIMILMDQNANVKIVSAEGSYEDILQRLKDNL